MQKLVKCPLCGKIQRTRGKHYFRCCQMAWKVEKHQILSYDEGRYTIPQKEIDWNNIGVVGYNIVDKRTGEILMSEDELRKLVGEILKEHQTKSSS